jgi:hypothetical protein
MQNQFLCKLQFDNYRISPIAKLTEGSSNPCVLCRRIPKQTSGLLWTIVTETYIGNFVYYYRLDSVIET